MTGKKGMIGSGGVRPGAGPPYKFAPRKNEHFIMERNGRSELLVFLSVDESGGAIVFQCGNDTITIRRPDAGELSLKRDRVTAPAKKG